MEVEGPVQIKVLQLSIEFLIVILLQSCITKNRFSQGPAEVTSAVAFLRVCLSFLLPGADMADWAGGAGYLLSASPHFKKFTFLECYYDFFVNKIIKELIFSYFQVTIVVQNVKYIE